MSQLYLETTSDTGGKKTRGGNREIEAIFLYGGKKGSRQALKATLTYDPEKKQTWLKITGPKHGTIENGKLIYDVSRQVLPAE